MAKNAGGNSLRRRRHLAAPARSCSAWSVDEWATNRDLRLRALSDSPDAFGSTLELEQRRPDEYWRERVAFAFNSALQMLLVAESATEPVGLALGWTDPDGTGITHVFQMWVAPEARGRGCATGLLDALLAWARRTNAKTVVLGVTCGNTAARRLYERAGFVPSGEPGPLRAGSALLVQPMILAL
jgi:ribosomal protein S18 acetylase RimI-like enzyme